MLMNLYGEAWEEQARDRIMAQRERPLTGAPMENPDPSDYDCVLVPNGGRMTLEPAGLEPVS
jgi:hypothetical protein